MWRLALSIPHPSRSHFSEDPVWRLALSTALGNGRERMFLHSLEPEEIPSVSSEQKDFGCGLCPSQWTVVGGATACVVQGKTTRQHLPLALCCRWAAEKSLREAVNCSCAQQVRLLTSKGPRWHGIDRGPEQGGLCQCELKTDG